MVVEKNLRCEVTNKQGMVKVSSEQPLNCNSARLTGETKAVVRAPTPVGISAVGIVRLPKNAPHVASAFLPSVPPNKS